MGRDLHARYQAAQQSRLPAYQAEVTLRQQLQVDDYTVHVHGRLDGLYEADDVLVVEEIKSLLVPQEQFGAIALGSLSRHTSATLALYIALLQRQQDGQVRGHSGADQSDRQRLHRAGCGSRRRRVADRRARTGVFWHATRPAPHGRPSATRRRCGFRSTRYVRIRRR